MRMLGLSSQAMQCSVARGPRYAPAQGVVCCAMSNPGGDGPQDLAIGAPAPTAVPLSSLLLSMAVQAGRYASVDVCVMQPFVR